MLRDDEYVDEETRIALRDLAREAEWGVPLGGYDLEAARLRGLGQSLLRRIGGEVQARDQVRDQDQDQGQDQDRLSPGTASWAQRAVTELAEHCRNASPNWSQDDVVTLARLRESALIALAPAPGQADGAATGTSASTSQQGSKTTSLTPLLERLPGGRRTAAIGLAAVGVVVVAGVVIAGTGGGHNAGPAASSTTARSRPISSPSDTSQPTTTSVPTSASTYPSASTSTSTGTSDSSSASSSASTTASTDTSAPSGAAHVTAIQMTATAADSYPEVQIYGNITASGTGDVTITFTVSGTSGSPQVTTEDESGQLSYALSRTIFLQQWCGQKSVTVTVSSGSVSKSSTVAVSGC